MRVCLPAIIKAYASVPLRSETYTSSGFIAPLLDGIGSHDCTTFRSETYAHFGFITPLRLSPLHASIILTQNTYSCSTAYPIPTHAEQICFALVKPLRERGVLLFSLKPHRASWFRLAQQRFYRASLHIAISKIKNFSWAILRYYGDCQIFL